MPDDSKPAREEGERINTNQYYDVRAWARSLGSTPDKVMDAVRVVGDRVENVRRYLDEGPTLGR